MEIQLEIDGRPVRVREGATVMDAANRLGVYIPHFCYHPRLSIAANCRMCLVDVAKAPKPLPACATPAVDGMVVRTASEKAKRAQHGVMEFLLINHPLDCPICDQGGECQLQDLAVGYGVSGSRYAEEKRVVVEKNLGPLIATDMTRCIHCTRCVRFGQEVAGVMELGMSGRGEHAEIMPFIARTVDSELSGNMIDICPVGALTSKPFRYTARPWELRNCDAIGAHDGWGSKLTAQIKGDSVMRVVPRKNDPACWISDRDRFSYRGLAAQSRAQTPLTKAKDATLWNAAPWAEALDFTAAGLREAASRHGAENIGFLCAPSATVEEAFLLQKFARALGSSHIDYRLRAGDCAAPFAAQKIPWLGLPIADIPVLSGALLVGANPARELPLLAHLLRLLAKRRQRKIGAIGVADIGGQTPLAAQLVVRPSELPHRLAAVLQEALRAAGKEEKKYADIFADFTPPDDDAPIREIAATLARDGTVIWLGEAALSHPRAGAILRLASALAEATNSRLGIFGGGANSVGAHFAGAIPRDGGKSAAAMISDPLPGYVLLHAEPADFYDAAAARRAFADAEFVAALAPFADEAKQFADAVLPVAAAAETDGAFISIEGKVQNFQAAVKPAGEARPAWKVLRVLAERLNLSGFDFASAGEIRAALFADSDLAGALDCRVEGDLCAADLTAPSPPAALADGALERIADLPMYSADAVVRRADALQKTRAATSARAVFLHPEELAARGLTSGAAAELRAADSDGGVARAEVFADASIPRGCIRAAAAIAELESLGATASAVYIRPAAAAQEA